MRFAKATVILLAGALAPALPLGAQQRPAPPRLSSIAELPAYEHTYPCSTGLLRTPVLVGALRRTLGPEYLSYRRFVQQAGCGQLEVRDSIVLMDVSQLHVGGWQSMILVREQDTTMWVAWLNEPVAPNGWVRFFGPRPIPSSVRDIVLASLIEGWAHVAAFVPAGDTVAIVQRAAPQ